MTNFVKVSNRKSNLLRGHCLLSIVSSLHLSSSAAQLTKRHSICSTLLASKLFWAKFKASEPKMTPITFLGHGFGTVGHVLFPSSNPTNSKIFKLILAQMNRKIVCQLKNLGVLAIMMSKWLKTRIDIKVGVELK